MEQYSFVISFEDVSDADASFYAGNLKAFIFDNVNNVTVDYLSKDKFSQSNGVELLVGIAGILIPTLARVIINWNQKHYGASVTITEEKGRKEFKLQNIDPSKAVELVAREMSKLADPEK